MTPNAVLTPLQLLTSNLTTRNGGHKTDHQTKQRHRDEAREQEHLNVVDLANLGDLVAVLEPGILGSLGGGVSIVYIAMYQGCNVCNR